MLGFLTAFLAIGSKQIDGPHLLAMESCKLDMYGKVVSEGPTIILRKIGSNVIHRIEEDL